MFTGLINYLSISDVAAVLVDNLVQLAQHEGVHVFGEVLVLLFLQNLVSFVLDGSSL